MEELFPDEELEQQQQAKPLSSAATYKLIEPEANTRNTRSCVQLVAGYYK